MLAEFDKTKRLYQDHQVGIHDKLVEIMTSRSQAHVKAMKTIDFDEISSADSDKPSAYVETLTKETLTLHRVLSRHLNEVDLSMIMRQISSGYKDQWTKAFGEVEVGSDAGKTALLKDAEVLEARLSKLEGFENVGKEVVEVVKGKGKEKEGVGKEKVTVKAEEKAEQKIG